MNSNNKQESPASEIESSLDKDLKLILKARHHDPFTALGRHPIDGKEVFRAFLPHAESARVGSNGPEMLRIPGTDLFECQVAHGNKIPEHYAIHWLDKSGQAGSHIDPYTFPPQIADFDLYLFGEGKHRHIYRVLGAHLQTLEGVSGVRFATWAPNAERVSVVGDFNDWDTARDEMQQSRTNGNWRITLALPKGHEYQFRYLVNGQDWHNDWHADKYARNKFGSDN